MRGIFFVLYPTLGIFGLLTLSEANILSDETLKIKLDDEHANFEPGVYLWQSANATAKLIEFVKTDDDNSKETGDYQSSNDFDWSDIAENIRLQPCRKHDSCKGRCIDFPSETATVAETEFFNCNCDPDCIIFGDCCWDYEDECHRLSPKDSIKEKDSSTSYTVLHNVKPNVDSFECAVVDQFSKEHFWIVTKCAASWPNDEIKRQCNMRVLDFATLLPVQGDTGWTYRNAFCAQCNFVTNFQYWEINARCFQSAPYEVLNGSSEMISYYLLHFCNNQLTRTSDLLPHPENGAAEKRMGSFQGSFKYDLPLRRCDKAVISKCPESYRDPFVEALCENYQSLVIHREYVGDEVRHRVFKNPVCAYCHGVGEMFDAHPDTMPSDPDVRPNTADIAGNFDELSWKPREDGTQLRQLECPIWLGRIYYDLPYWALSSIKNTRSMLPKFSSTKDSESRWTPPAFSMLLHFRQDGSNEVTYTDGGNSSTKSISPDTTCNHGEIYDPFYASCRPVLCTPDEQFTGSSCIPVDASQQQQQQQSGGIPIARTTATITLVIEIPAEQIDANVSMATFSSSLEKDMQNLVERMYHANVTGVTVLNVTVIDTHSTDGTVSEKAKDDNSVTFAFAFVLVEPEKYTEAEIIEFVEHVNEYVKFQKLLLEADYLMVLVLSTPRIGQIPLTCADGTKKLQYTSEQYELIDYEGRLILHINETDEYYLESEYQFLDWTIQITENETARTCVEDSRVMVCAEIPEVLTCDIYVPLNVTEYDILDNGTLYMIDRDATIPPDEYIMYDNTVAVCADRYVSNSTSKGQDEPQTESYEAWMTVGVWITFGLSMLSLLALAITFITYLLFRDLRTVSGFCIMNLAVAQFSSVTIFMFGANATSNPAACTTVAIVLHYLFLSIFFWNNVMAFDVWRIFGQGLKNALRRSVQNRLASKGNSSGTGKTVFKYMAYAWGVPALVVGVATVLEFCADSVTIGYKNPYGICWISNTTANIALFGIPVFAILMINGVFFVLSIIAIRKSTNAPLKNVGEKQNAFRRKLASVSDEIRTNEADPGPKCESYKTRQSVSEAWSDSEKGFRRSTSFSSIETGCSHPQELEQAQRDIRKKIAGRGAGRKRSSNAEGITTSSRRQSMSNTISPETRISTKRARSSVLVYAKMSTVMGFSWIIGFAAVFVQVLVLWILFEISVSLQGIFIFCAFVCKKRILRQYQALFSSCCGGKKPAPRRSSQSTTIQERRQSAYIQRQNASSSSLDDVFMPEKPKAQWRSHATDPSFEKYQKDQMDDTKKKVLSPTHIPSDSVTPNLDDPDSSVDRKHEGYVNVTFTVDENTLQDQSRPDDNIRELKR